MNRLDNPFFTMRNVVLPKSEAGALEAGVKPLELRNGSPPLRSAGALIADSSSSSSSSSRNATPGRDDGMAGAAALARSCLLLGGSVGDGGGSGLAAAAAALALAMVAATPAGRAPSTCSSCDRGGGRVGARRLQPHMLRLQLPVGVKAATRARGCNLCARGCNP